MWEANVARHSIIMLVGLVWASGCATVGPTTPALQKTDQPLLQPSVAVPATVTLINRDLRFVVLDFGDRPRPPLGTVVELVRDEQVVARVQLTEPMRGRFVTADIVEGEPRVGDQVR
ncbi:MAG: hypothetical protein NZ483_03740 [Verrucomicrobiae bacterium]|nr:hypothetical protein [Verrucomicrobiae bacterium]MDW8344651.1 hypothetical protein [Verrucomicrobiae bacterium]